VRSSSTSSAVGELNDAWARSGALPVAPSYILLSINAHIYGGVVSVGGWGGVGANSATSQGGRLQGATK